MLASDTMTLSPGFPRALAYVLPGNKEQRCSDRNPSYLNERTCPVNSGEYCADSRYHQSDASLGPQIE